MFTKRYWLTRWLCATAVLFLGFGPLLAAEPVFAAPVRTGAGQKIGVPAFSSFRQSDVADWLAFAGLPASLLGQVSQIHVGGGAPIGPDQTDVLLAIATILTLAPGAQIAVYDAPFAGPGVSFQSLLSAMIDDGVTIISNSFGYCEDQTTLADVQSIDAILAAAAASGITVLSATGDLGPDCRSGAIDAVMVPASAPHATAVGGTSLTLGPGGTYGGESWWDGFGQYPPGGQGGYGVSRFFSRPAYQDGLIGGAMRSVPDIVAPADPSIGPLLCQADAGGCPTGVRYGGTSLATPILAAYIAILNEALGTPVGFLNPLLYPLAGSEAFHSAVSMGSDPAKVGLGSVNGHRLHLALAGITPGPVDASTSAVLAYSPPQPDPYVNALAPVPADGTSTARVVVYLRDADENIVAGKTVSLSASPGGGVVISPPSGVSNIDNGAVAFTVKSTTAGTVVFTATADGVVLNQAASVEFAVPPAESGSITASPNIVTANGIATTTITVTLQDGLGRPTPGKLVTLSQGDGHSQITAPVPSVTNADGQIHFTATNLVNEVVTYRAIDVTDGNLAVPGEAVVAFHNGSGTACGQTLPVPKGLNGYTVSPFVTGFPTGNLFFSNVNYGGCTGVAPPAFLNGYLYAPNLLNGDLFKLEPTGGAVSSANRLSTLGPTLGWLVVGKDGRLYGLRSGTGGNFNTGIIVELDPNTGAIMRTLASGLTCPAGLAVDPLSGDLFFIDQCFGAGSDNPSLFRLKNPGGASPEVSVYAALPATPNGQLVFSPKGSIYVVSNYLLPNPMVVRVSGTDGPTPPTVTVLPDVFSSYWLNIASVGPDGEATVLITLNDGKLRLVDITSNPPTVLAEMTENVGGGIIGPDGCLYMPNATAIYKLTDPSGGCSFLATSAAPLLLLSPSMVSPDPPQGTVQEFTASFRNVNVPEGTPVFLKVIGPNLQTRLARTDASGRATFSYIGTFTGTDAVIATAALDPDTTLASNAVGVTWTEGRHTTFLDVSKGVTSGRPGAPVVVAAVLTDVSADPAGPVSGASVRFDLAGAHCTGVTDEEGVARCELPPNGSAGIVPLVATFAGSAQFTPATASTSFALVASAEGGPIDVGPAHLWVGLKNSDDQGTQFDVRVRVLAGSTVVAEGVGLCVTHVTRNPADAREVTVPLQPLANGDPLPDGPLRVEIATRIGTTPQGTRCPGPGGSHASAVGLRLYYDSVAYPSRIALGLGSGAVAEWFLDSDGGVCVNRPAPATSFFLDAAAPTAAQPKCRDSAAITFSKGNGWRVIGTWNVTGP